MTNQPLIPTPRTDKNGRTVIRHMKPQGEGTVSKKLPTAPLSIAKTQEQLLKETVDTLTDLIATVYPDKEGVDHVRETALNCFHWFTPKTLSEINSYPWNPRKIGNFVYKVAGEGWSENEPIVRDYVAMFETLESVKTSPEWVLRGIGRYEGICPQSDNGDYPEERREQLNALFTVTGHLIDTGVTVSDYDSYFDDSPMEYYIRDEKLRAFIIDPGEDYTRDEIVNIITTRNVIDVDGVKDLLTLKERALRSGAL